MQISLPQLGQKEQPRLIKAPLSYTLRNRLNWHFISGWLAVMLAYLFSTFTQYVLGNRIACFVGTLSARVRRFNNPDDVATFKYLRKQGRYAEAEAFADEHAQWIDYGVLSYRVITDAGVTFLRDDWNNNAQDFTTFNYHGCGTGIGAEAVGDTALGTESTTALNPDSTRATGTRSTPASNQFRSVGTLTFDADAAVTEHGLFSQSATGGGTLWDRSKFSAINVVGANSDSIQFTYTCTMTSGG